MINKEEILEKEILVVEASIKYLKENILELEKKITELKTKISNIEDMDRQDVKVSKAEMRVLELLPSGKTNKQIGKDIFISEHTVKAHVCSLMQKFCVETRVQVVTEAIKLGIINV